jgi:hypothetical protein
MFMAVHHDPIAEELPSQQYHINMGRNLRGVFEIEIGLSRHKV